MANVIDPYIPRIIARGLSTYRAFTVAPMLVNSDYSNEARKKGDVIRIPKSQARGTSPVVPAAVPTQAADDDNDLIELALNHWIKADPFYITDDEVHQMSVAKDYMPLKVEECGRAIAEYVNAVIYEEMYKSAYTFLGTAAAIPFATNIAPSIRAAMHKLRIPRRNRSCVLDPDAEANALSLDAFASFDQTGDRKVKIEGELGRKYGINWFVDQDMPLHTKGTMNTATLVATNTAVGATSVPCDTGTGNLKRGDIIVFESHSQTYVVTADVANVASGTIPIDPPLKVAVDDGDTILFATNFGTSIQNLAFAREAIGFATRPLASISAELGSDGGHRIMSLRDKSGLSLRLEISRQYKQTMFEFDILCGAKTIKSDGIVRIIGAPPA